MYLRILLRINWESTAGYSEQIFAFGSSTTAPSVVSFARDYANARARCMVRQSVIVDAQIIDAENPGLTNTVVLGLPGALPGLSTIDPDVPLLCPRINLGAGPGVSRDYILRGLPDKDVQGGQFTAAESGPAVYTTFKNWLRDNSVRIKHRFPKPAVPQPLVLANGLGILTTGVGSTLPAVNNYVGYNTRAPGNGRKYSSIGKVLQVDPGSLSFRVKPWSNGECEGGEYWVTSYSFPLIDYANISIPQRCRTHKVGRPFGSYVGRASAKQ